MQILSLLASIPLPRVGGYCDLGRGTTTQGQCAECFQVAYPATLRGQASQTQSSAQGCRAGISCNLSGSVLGAWSHFLEQREEENIFPKYQEELFLTSDIPNMRMTLLWPVWKRSPQPDVLNCLKREESTNTLPLGRLSPYYLKERNNHYHVSTHERVGQWW